MSQDPFAVLGLSPDAGVADVQGVLRRLALRHHPDVGGDAEEMRRINVAVSAALAVIAERERSPRSPRPGHGRGPQPPATVAPSRAVHDTASFTIEALPVEAFEALTVVVTWFGELLVDEPPYLLEAHLEAPRRCWCRLELVPDAGASTVSLTVAAVEVGPPPDVDRVRDVWVEALNRLDWDQLDR